LQLTIPPMKSFVLWLITCRITYLLREKMDLAKEYFFYPIQPSGPLWSGSSGHVQVPFPTFYTNPTLPGRLTGFLEIGTKRKAHQLYVLEANSKALLKLGKSSRGQENGFSFIF
jgi:hypothetical protein